MQCARFGNPVTDIANTKRNRLFFIPTKGTYCTWVRLYFTAHNCTGKSTKLALLHIEFGNSNVTIPYWWVRVLLSVQHRMVWYCSTPTQGRLPSIKCQLNHSRYIAEANCQVKKSKHNVNKTKYHMKKLNYHVKQKIPAHEKIKLPNEKSKLPT